MSEKDDLVVVFAGSVFDATLAKNLLEGAQIEAFLQDEQMGRLIPFYLSAMSAGAVKVAVRPADAEEARIVLSATDESIARGGRDLGLSRLRRGHRGPVRRLLELRDAPARG